MTSTQQKYLFYALAGIGIVSLIGAISSSPTMPSRENANISESVDLIQELPESSNATYSTAEYTIINDVTTKGMVLRQYKRTLTGSAHKNLDLERVYKDYDRDMEQYSRYIKEDYLKLQAQRPARESGQQAQVDTLSRLGALYERVSTFRQHETSIQDTLSYLNDCIYDLERVSQQAKMMQ